MVIHELATLSCMHETQGCCSLFCFLPDNNQSSMLSLFLSTYICNLLPELGIGDYCFRTEKGAGPLSREHRGSNGAQGGSRENTGGALRCSKRGRCSGSSEKSDLAAPNSIGPVDHLLRCNLSRPKSLHLGHSRGRSRNLDRHPRVNGEAQQVGPRP